MKDSTHLTWIGRRTFQLDELRFMLALPPLPPDAPSATPEEHGAFIVFKPRNYIDDYARILENERPKRVLEFGIYAGGSVVLWQKVWNLDKIVGVDIARSDGKLRERVAAVGLSGHVHLHFGIDQGDAPAVERIIEMEFGDQSLDIIIDDASHALVPTTRSLVTAFPYLRPGGWYIIEDWNWELYEAFAAHKQHGLLRLIDAMVRISGELNPPIFQVIVTRQMVAIQKSRATPQPELPRAMLLEMAGD